MTYFVIMLDSIIPKEFRLNCQMLTSIKYSLVYKGAKMARSSLGPG